MVGWDDYGQVALLAEGVDRNIVAIPCEKAWGFVALLAEGVDRNRLLDRTLSNVKVALLAEGVDRNLQAVSMAL